jgi:hypothetical protein
LVGASCASLDIKKQLRIHVEFVGGGANKFFLNVSPSAFFIRIRVQGVTTITVYAAAPCGPALACPRQWLQPRYRGMAVPAAATRCAISTSTGDLGIGVSTTVVRPSGVVSGMGLGLGIILYKPLQFPPVPCVPSQNLLSPLCHRVAIPYPSMPSPSAFR